MNQPSLIEVLRTSANRYPDLPAIIEPGATYSFSDVDRLSDRVAGGLASQGIHHGDRVALYCINSADFAIAYMGIVKAGAVVVPVNLLQRPSEISMNLNDAGVSAFIFHAAFQDNAEQILEAVETIRCCVGIGTPNSANYMEWDEMLDAEVLPPQPKIRPDEDLAAILYTSGTTGKPKGAMLTHTNLVSNTQSVRQAMQWQPGKDRVLLVLPMFHAFAATVGMLTPLTCGCALVPMVKFEPSLVAQVVNDQAATLFLGVPSMYSVMLHLKDAQVAGFKTIRACISGGAAMPVEVLHRFEEKFQLPIYEGDGPTECSPVTCVNPFGGVRKPGTVGLPVPGVEMRIVDDQGQPAPVGTVGEIAVRGKCVMKGYWGLPEETRLSFSGEWFLTGDIGTEDEDGYFSIIDRKKDMVIVNGMNVYPRMVEEVLYRYEPILEAAVVGQPDKRHGEVLVAYVSIKPDRQIGEMEIKTWCRNNLGSYQVPKRIVILELLPKNATGKIMKRELRLEGEVERGVTPAPEGPDAEGSNH